MAFHCYELTRSSFEPSPVSGYNRVTVKRPLVARLTKYIVETYQKCNAGFKYSDALNPKCFLTKPSMGILNDGYDNEDSHLILYVNLVICNSGSKQRYVVEDLLGQGTFAQVAKCRDMETNNYVAMKIIKNLPQYHEHGKLEVHILSMLNKKFDPDDEHHIVRMLDNFLFRKHLCISFELLGLNLYELLAINNHNGLSLSIISALCRQILDALIITGNAGIIHCDLKPENLAISLNKKAPTVKVIDFGSACFMSKTIYTYIQSRYYRSPEVLLGYPYTTAIDMWSLGCIAAELFLGYPLFPGASEYDVLKRMTEILGDQPPDHLLRAASKTRNFFKQVSSIYRLVDDQTSKKNCSSYQLLTEEDFGARGLVRPEIGKKHYLSEKLEDIIQNRDGSKQLAEEQCVKEKVLRFALIDFLRHLLEFDPVKRWSPLQALQHPFVTGKSLLFPYKPLPETPVIVENNPRQGHRIAVCFSPEVTIKNKYFPHNISKVQIEPSFYGSSYGSSGRNTSYNYSTSIGSGCWSYSDTNSMSAYHSPPVHRSLLQQIAQAGSSTLASSANARLLPFCHGNDFGGNPSYNFRSTSLEANSSQFPNQDLKVHKPTMFQGSRAEHDPAECSFYSSPQGNASEIDRERKLHQDSYGSYENSFMCDYGRLDDGMICSKSYANFQEPVGSSNILTSSSYFKNGPEEVLWDKPKSSYFRFGPGDWDPNYRDELLFHEGSSESLESTFDSILRLGYSMNSSTLTSGTNALALNHQKAHLGSNFPCPNHMNNPNSRGLHSGDIDPVFFPNFFTLQNAENIRRSPQQFNQVHSTMAHSLRNHQKTQEQ